MKLLRKLMQHTRSIGPIVSFVLLALFLVACGSSTGATAKPPLAASPAVTVSAPAASASPAPTSGAATNPAKAPVSTVTIHANDFSLKLDRSTVAAGTAHFVLINDSKDYKHEVWVYPQNQPNLAEMLRLKESGQDVDEENYLQGIAGGTEETAPGQTASVDVTLSPGVYEFICFVTSTIGGKPLNHYSLGMHSLVTVTAP